MRCVRIYKKKKCKNPVRYVIVVEVCTLSLYTSTGNLLVVSIENSHPYHNYSTII